MNAPNHDSAAIQTVPAAAAPPRSESRIAYRASAHTAGTRNNCAANGTPAVHK